MFAKIINIFLIIFCGILLITFCVLTITLLIIWNYVLLEASFTEGLFLLIFQITEWLFVLILLIIILKRARGKYSIQTLFPLLILIFVITIALIFHLLKHSHQLQHFFLSGDS
jgi:hypothetical protein